MTTTEDEQLTPMSLIEQALQDAQHSLSEAIQKLQNGESLDNDDKAVVADSTSNDNVTSCQEEVDPEVLFFMQQQAKKKEQETKLPVNEWARTAVACHIRKTTERREDEHGQATAEKVSQARLKLRTQLIDKLFLEFQGSMDKAAPGK